MTVRINDCYRQYKHQNQSHISCKPPWKVSLGEGNAAIRNHPLLKGVALPDRLGSPNSRGGAMVTKGGLVFIGGGDGYLYAFDKKTGKEVWRGKIPYENTANPMFSNTRTFAFFKFLVTKSSCVCPLTAATLTPARSTSPVF